MGARRMLSARVKLRARTSWSSRRADFFGFSWPRRMVVEWAMRAEVSATAALSERMKRPAALKERVALSSRVEGEGWWSWARARRAGRLSAWKVMLGRLGAGVTFQLLPAWARI